MKQLKHICVAGDSLLRGVVLNEVNRYVFCKSSAVNLFQQAHPSLSVDNLSKFGCTAPRGLERFLKALEKGNQYDGVLIEYGGNDCDFCWDEVAEAPDAPHQTRTDIAEYEASCRRLIESAQNAGITPFVMTLPPIDAELYFDWVSKGEAERGGRILRFIREKSAMYRNQELYSSILEKIAREYQLFVIPVRRAFLQLRNLREYLCVDGIHPNERGQALIGQVFDGCYREAVLK